MKYWTVDIPYHSHRRCRASKCDAGMGYIWKLCSHSFPIQWIASAFLPIHFPYIKLWQNWAPYQFHIFTQPSHTIPRYGSYMAHVFPYHSHTFSLVRVVNWHWQLPQNWGNLTGKILFGVLGSTFKVCSLITRSVLRNPVEDRSMIILPSTMILIEEFTHSHYIVKGTSLTIYYLLFIWIQSLISLLFMYS